MTEVTKALEQHTVFELAADGDATFKPAEKSQTASAA
jgi:hypothetical protein